ncbi:hypothetical protein CC2G_009770 [Coprinopsis cinerea AmutBmut pab1-1]|nr:hypothetical protein CC2G_009770 [Coprinopsis cinerea AmutBmut pab1-1]
MNFQVGPRMVLDALLLSMGEITSIIDPAKDVAIIPEMKTGGAAFSKGGYQVVLGGSIDYGVVEYMIDEDDEAKGGLVGPVLPEHIFEVAYGFFFLVEAKRHHAVGELTASIPEAVTQAMLISKNANIDTVRFCLSDGSIFIFFVLQRCEDGYTYSQSTPRYLGLPEESHFDIQMGEITFLLLEWLKVRLTEELYTLA